MPRIGIKLDEQMWKRLRDVAETHRTRGRASVSAIIEKFIAQGLAEQGQQ